jgi:PDZ domain-containing protein
MKRRGWTVLIGAILVALMTWQALAMRVAYVGLGPGPTVDALGEVDDGQHDPVELITANTDAGPQTKGQLRLVTVRIHDELQLGQALYYWLSDDYAVIPRQLQYPDDKSEEQIAEEQNEMWVNSQSAAETAALRVLGQPVEVTVTKVKSDAGDALRKDDVITAVDGDEVTSQQKLISLLTAAESAAPDDEVELTVDRDGKTDQAVVDPQTVDKEVVIPGVTIKPVQDDPFDVETHADDLGIGGPSAGLIFALAMIDKAGGEDLTGGNVIAGTGEIDEDGNVGPIGGVAQKVVAARGDGAPISSPPPTTASRRNPMSRTALL